MPLVTLYDLPQGFNAVTGTMQGKSADAPGICFGASVVWSRLAVALKGNEQSSLPPIVGEHDRCGMLQYKYENCGPTSVVVNNVNLAQRHRAVQVIKEEGLGTSLPTEFEWRAIGIDGLCTELFGQHRLGTYIFYMRGQVGRNGKRGAHFMAFRRMPGCFEFFDDNTLCARAPQPEIWSDTLDYMSNYLWDHYILGPLGENFIDSVLIYGVYKFRTR